MRILLIHNPDAGADQPDAKALLELIAAAGHHATYQSSQIDDLAGPVNHPWDLVVAAGGDGTVSRVIKVCAGHPAPIAILPLGTANNIAAALGHIGALQDLIRAWDLNSVRPVDMGVATGDWGRSRFAECFGAGLLAETMISAKGNNKKAAASRTVTDRLAAAVKAMRKRLKDLEPERMTLESPEGPHTGDFLWAEVSTVGLVGPRLPILDSDDPADGLLAFALLPEAERDTFADYLEARQDGRAARLTGLITGRAPRLSLTWSAGAAHLDGKLLPDPDDQTGPRRAELEIQPSAVRVLRLVR